MSLGVAFYITDESKKVTDEAESVFSSFLYAIMKA